MIEDADADIGMWMWIVKMERGKLVHNTIACETDKILLNGAGIQLIVEKTGGVDRECIETDAIDILHSNVCYPSGHGWT